jgi:hypothetical protein
LLEEAAVHERVCGFLLLVEHRDYVAVFKSKLDVPAGFATRHFGRVPTERIDVAIASQDAVFQKIRLRNMSVSKHAMPNKMFEADDLREVVGPVGATGTYRRLTQSGREQSITQPRLAPEELPNARIASITLPWSITPGL